MQSGNVRHNLKFFNFWLSIQISKLFILVLWKTPLWKTVWRFLKKKYNYNYHMTQKFHSWVCTWKKHLFWKNNYVESNGEDSPSYCQSVSSVIQLSLTLCNPMNCSTPGLPVHHQLLEFTQTHVQVVGDAV